MNIRDFVSNDHIESPFEIIKTQGVAIQAHMLENEQLQKELKSVYDKLTNKDKKIQRLNNIVNSDFAQICKDKMIDKLSATEMIVVQEKEIKRLNNIIEELEKWLKEENYKNEDFWCINSIEVLNKLKALKEGK